ncbi:MAG: phosphate acyltransferase PlsX [Actinomycetota bacterium]
MTSESSAAADNPSAGTATDPSPDGSSSRPPVAVDAMGGDHGPGILVEGARRAAEVHGTPVLLVGDPDRLGDVGDLPISPASEVVDMGADPAKAVRRLKDSSIVRAAEAVRDGRASSVMSAGNTGAAMAASLLRMGRIKGVARPAIAVPFPVLGSTPSTLLDCGANADCQPEWLVQFARMGTAYARQRFDLAHPRVGILTIGEEAGKGNTMVKAACELLEDGGWATECGADYVGNVEGGDLMRGVADVIVCDGFTGNVALKSLEGGFDLFKSSVREALGSTPALVEVSAEIDEVIDPLFQIFNAGNTGAAMLLGTRGVTMIAHGSSSAITIANAIKTADQMAGIGIVDSLRAAVGNPAE